MTEGSITESRLRQERERVESMYKESSIMLRYHIIIYYVYRCVKHAYGKACRSFYFCKDPKEFTKEERHRRTRARAPGGLIRILVGCIFVGKYKSF